MREESTTPDEGVKTDDAIAAALASIGLKFDGDPATTICLLCQEISLTDVYIEGVYREVFGPTKPMPTAETSFSVGPRRTALKRIMGVCARVEWRWKQVGDQLPEGAILDESCPGAEECHGSQSWCEVCGDVRRTCDDADRCDEHCQEALVRRFGGDDG